MPSAPRRAAVLGMPVAHSLSPVLHGAAYAALGLDGWTYERVECDAASLPAWVRERDASWAGMSVTMPGKRAALAVADSVSRRARVLGVANTLVRSGHGHWHADCTDVEGVAGALRAAAAAGAPLTARFSVAGLPDAGVPDAGVPDAGVPDAGVPGAGFSAAVVLGAGATAAAALGGLSELGTENVTLVARDPARAADALAVARAFGMTRRVRTWSELADDDLAQARALVNTTPAGGVDAAWAARLVGAVPASSVVLDAIYHPWPTPLAAAAGERGLAVATGLDMLLHQAFGQVEQFTGRPAPREVMRDALTGATGFPLSPLP